MRMPIQLPPQLSRCLHAPSWLSTVATLKPIALRLKWLPLLFKGDDFSHTDLQAACLAFS
jgi:hypothetical protein